MSAAGDCPQIREAVQRKADPVLLLFKAGFLIKVVSGRVSFGLERDVPKAVLTGIISDQLDPQGPEPLSLMF